ncbi:MAG: hemolysin family protein [Phycisphaerae bacterium]
MLLTLGLVALVGLTLYISTLTLVLRSYSRSAVADELDGGHESAWLAWLDRHESTLQLVAGFVRTLLILAVLLAGCAWYMVRIEARIDLAPAVVPVLAVVAGLAVFAIGVPHALARYAGESILAASLPALAGLRWVLWPVAQALHGVEFVVRRLLGVTADQEPDQVERIEQEVLDAVSGGEFHGAVDEEQKEMIQSIFRLNQTTVSAIMTPRTDIYGVRADASLAEARGVVIDSAHSRVPVFEGSIDHVVGVLYAKDLLKLEPGEPFDARRIMRNAPYVPATKTIDALLNEFRAAKVQIAIVLDEYGGTAGLVTIEDILEELVGEIDDEYDQPAAPTLRRVDDETIEVDARVHVSEVNEELGIALPEDADYETIGGYVCTTLGRIPAAGDEFTRANVRFEVLDAEPRKVNRVRIRFLREAQPAS